MSLDKLLDQVKGVILQHVEGGDSDSDVDTGALLNKVESLFGQHADNTGQPLRSKDQGDDSDDNDDQDDDEQDDEDRNDRQSRGRGKDTDDDDEDGDNDDSDDDDK